MDENESKKMKYELPQDLLLNQVPAYKAIEKAHNNSI